MRDIKATISQVDIADLLFGMQQLCKGLEDGVFAYSLDAVLTNNKDFSTEDNAQIFLEHNYDALVGANRLMAAATGIITMMLANGEIDIVPKDGGASSS